MLAKIKQLFWSRKFLMTMAGTIVCTALSFAGAPNELIAVIAGLFGVNVASHAYTDAKAALPK